jgi:hypothetical protein
LEDRSKWNINFKLIFCVFTLAYGIACSKAVRDVRADAGALPPVAAGAASFADDSQWLSTAPMDAQPNIASFGGSDLSQYTLPATTSNPSNVASQVNIGSDVSVAANLPVSNGLDRDLESVRLATQMESALTDRKDGLLSTAAMNAVVGIYQAAGKLVSAESVHSESGDLKSTIVVRTGGVPSNSTPSLWRSHFTGYHFHFPVD